MGDRGATDRAQASTEISMASCWFFIKHPLVKLFSLLLTNQFKPTHILQDTLHWGLEPLSFPSSVTPLVITFQSTPLHIPHDTIIPNIYTLCNEGKMHGRISQALQKHQQKWLNLIHIFWCCCCPLTNLSAVLLASTDFKWYFKDH